MTKTPDYPRFAAALEAVARDVERLLAELLSDPLAEGEVSRPARLVEAMCHASLGGGKRLRPFLVVQSAELFAVPRERALMAGAALECVHCYSLVHDDLPAMDNDDMRRGRPTVHKAFDEATAILAGDCLLTFAFDLLSRPQTHSDASVRIALVLALSRAAGLGGMAGGQMFDLAAEGRFAEKLSFDEFEVARLQSMKTGALLHLACIAGALLGAASPDAHAALSQYGRALGQAFQIADDLLDVEGDPALLGKSARKDAPSGKATLVGILGITEARKRLGRLVAEAETALSPFGAKADILRAAAHFVAERHN
ncbi:MAG: polyprenyl synthetase family protein [Rhizobiales bacterium]|nr:polyprenyl synthetase family protein [Hyphomicrobiales bacterium]